MSYSNWDHQAQEEGNRDRKEGKSFLSLQSYKCVGQREEKGEEDYREVSREKKIENILEE